MPLRPPGSTVKLYTGKEKTYQEDCAAVIELDNYPTDLQQCADVCIRLRAEYLFAQKRFDDIAFHLTNGWLMEYRMWRRGHRLKVEGNRTSWVHSATANDSYESFRQYLAQVFTYADTLSLSRELQPVSYSELRPGDIMVTGGSPGHAVMVADVAENSRGQKTFMLLQGFMPAQDAHILINPLTDTPWFEWDESTSLMTAEYEFINYVSGRFR